MKRGLPEFAVIGLLMVGYAASYAGGGFIQDTSRDVYFAHEIAAGRWFPLEGPILGGAIHLGPLWYYLLALPALAGGGWLSIALFAGALTALQFPLAFDCGTRLLDRRFGLLWALSLALPGWTTFQSLLFFNPNPAGAMVLAALALWLRADKARFARMRAGAGGLLVSVGLHIHPTTAPIALLVADGLRRSSGAGVRPLPLAVLLAIGFALPFLPYLASQWANGMPDAAGAVHYLDNQIAAVNLLAVPQLLWAFHFSGPAHVFKYLWPSSSASNLAPVAIDALPLAAAFVLLVRGTPRERLVLAGLAAALLVFTAWSALMRSATPEYFLYAAAPFASGLVALGLRVLLNRAGPLAAAVLLVQLVAIVAVPLRMAAVVTSGEGTLDSRILDVGNAQARTPFSETWFPAWGHPALGRLLCSPHVVLHGPLAFIADLSVGADALFECGTVENAVLMGPGDPKSIHWAGLSRRFWSRLGASPECWLGSLGLVSSIHVHAPSHGLPIAGGGRYLPRERDTVPASPRHIDFEADGHEALLVTSPLHGYAAVTNVRAAVDGHEQRLVAHDDLSWLYVPSGDAGAVRWSVSFDASNPNAVDVVTFPAHRQQSTPRRCFP